MADARAKFNDETDPSFQFKDQCTAFKAICTECGTKFPSGSRTCPKCGATRPRCTNHVVKGEVVCRKHMKGRPYSLYSKLAATLTDTELEEMLEADDRDLSQEYLLARVCLSGALDPNHRYTSDEMMKMIKDFFTIAEKKKNIEQGQMLNISFNDEMVNSLRSRIRKMIKVFGDVVKENVPDEALQTKIMTDLYNRVRLPGNMISSPPKASEYVQPAGDEEQFNARLDEINADLGAEAGVNATED